MSNIQEFDYTVNLSPVILWEYNEATALNSLINQKNAWYTANQTQFWTDWCNKVFSVLSVPPEDLTIADHQFGLNLWSIILNLPLQEGDPPDPFDKPQFGFDFGGTYTPTTYGNQNFYYSNFSDAGFSPGLTLDQQQLLLRLRYFNLTTRGDIPDINKFVNYAFQGVTGFSGTVYALDPGNMTIIYIFTGSLSRTLLDILTKWDILPRPAGVGIKIYSDLGLIFGFGSFNQNFNNGCFIGD